MEYSKGLTLLTGDVLVTKTKGHTVVVVEGDRKKTVHEIAREVIDGKWGSGQDRKNRLHAAGYDYAVIQAEVNRILKPVVTPQHIGDAGLELIKKYEGCRLTAYRLAGEDYYTIGWGHHGADVLPNMTISQERADELLRLDLVKFEGYVRQYVTDIPLTRPRFDALVSYCYNRGPKGLKQLADNCHTVEEYTAGIVTYWGSAQRYKEALLRRRRDEQALFCI
jgi:GH24 family phage-related lysozyme (muramidase)